MTQSHCLKCPALEEMREGLELSNIMDMVTFFRRVLEERFLDRCIIRDALHDSCALEAIWRLIEGAHKCTRIFIDLMP